MTIRRTCISPRSLLAASICSIGVVAGANGQQLPKEGQFKITYSAVITSPAKPVALSRTKDVVFNNAIMTASNDAGSGLLHNQSGRCAIMATIDKEAKTIERFGHCSYTDKDGDMVFEDFATPPQPIGAAFTSKGAWTGGTGKYAGLSGEFDIQSMGILSTESLVQVVGKKMGSYKISEPVAAK